MDRTISPQETLTLFKNTIYDNYLNLFKEYQDRNLAYKQTSYAIENLLRNDNFRTFTTNSNSVDFSNPQYYSDLILEYFTDTILSYVPEEPLKRNLFNAMVTTLNNYGKPQVIGALNGVMKSNNYDSFSRFSNKDKSINYRKILEDTLPRKDMAQMISNTIMDSIILEKQAEHIQARLQQLHPNKVDNLQINPQTINLCKQHVQSGEQLTFKRCDYSVGNDLYASIDMGNKRKNQEDSVIILNHPKNPDFKMLVVADGAGGSDAGELASSYITSHMTEWFESLDSRYFAAENIGHLRQQFELEIQNMNKNLYQTYKGKAYSTFVGAIVADKETLISNVGDSRAYAYAQGNLQQITEDDSFAYNLWKQGKIKEKSHIRFHQQSNIITKAMGFQEDVTPSTTTLSNASYDSLLLFSDGLTDCLSDRQIMAITRSTSPKDLAKALVNAALANDSVNNSLNPDEYENHIRAGKDNTTAAVYDNRANKSKDEGR